MRGYVIQDHDGNCSSLYCYVNRKKSLNLEGFINQVISHYPSIITRFIEEDKYHPHRF